MTLSKDSIRGLFTATTTPLTTHGQLHAAAIPQQVEVLLSAGMTGLVPVGGTGEGAALTLEERTEVVKATVAAVNGRVPVVAGVVTPGLPDTLKAGRAFLDAGADSLMVITPFGTAPTQQGIRDYFKAVADAFGQAVMLYDIPYLTLVATQPETVRSIVDDGSIFAMKASNPDQALFTKLLNLVGSEIAIMSGDEDLFAVEVALGAVGGVLASSNILPHTWVEIFETANSGDLAGAQRQLARLSNFITTVYSEPNPGPMKAAQAIAGFDVGPVRLPNKNASTQVTEAMRSQLAKLLAYERQLSSR
ncbi:hypothetical protein QV13_07895 [Mesorhizobium hungaricum]|jgi:4-hydroxy-tetrahydrodipicolinate synthase|uniref:Dihydrodipicolinate synthase family protein n=1 Tax=Mesorhizobium hungaricum TaxID=1566387 RepID=A0A1C2E3H6_9HYPH|nr:MULTISPECIES: dihydrodipicolinate synthase family protein [Mesorhizobium]MBN9235906.1 dihydrodipicolinate synthase family protein [Mesorhizobium sp.]MDQ0332994.1 4-hydroxy-tetrahydrodipicolinate synthase [Mesorhizobium sp. YL-MeA3-2017]OCX21562.1 hypothetical protein QV13_07895 [Mesorhizobium hungaricum]